MSVISDSVGQRGTVAALWAMKQDLTGGRGVLPAEDEDGDAFSFPAEDEDDVRVVAGSGALLELKNWLLDTDVMTSSFVPRFVADCVQSVSDNVGAWCAATSARPHAETGVVLELCTVNPCASSSHDATTSGARRLHAEMRRLCMFSMSCVSYVLRSAGRSLRLPKVVRVTILPCSQPRRYPSSLGEPLGPEHVNAGVCSKSFASDVTRVFVYRSQHLHKVLIHEMMHALEVERALHSGDEEILRTEREVMTALGVRSDAGRLNMAEAHTEVLACYFHMYWKMLRRVRARDPGLRTSEDLMHAVNALWKEERALYLGACRGILEHFSGGVLPPPPSSVPSMHERTSVLSYYFAKAALWEDSLDDVPALVTERPDARRFADLYRAHLLNPDFWTLVLSPESHSESTSRANGAPLMTVPRA